MVLSADKSVVYNKLKGVVGAANVTDKDIILEAYTATGTHAGRTTEEREASKKPSFVVNAGSTEEIQAIVRLANEYKVPIVPIGAFTGVYRDAVPLEGGIMLDMKRMKGIEIDEDVMTVTIEPGVTWAQAYRELAAKGYWISNQALPAAISIMGTTTQAGPHLPDDKHAVPNSSYYSTLTMGLEVVLPTGELLVTGSAALPGTKPQRPRAYGPDIGTLFLGAQGTLGIIVKQTLPLWRIPEVRHTVTGLFKDENFKGLSTAMHRIVSSNFAGGPIWIEKVWSVYKSHGEGQVFRQPWKRPGEWELYVQVYGLKDRVEFDKEFVEKIITDEGGKVAAPGESEWPDIEITFSPGPPYEEAIFWRPRVNSIVLPPPLSLDQCRAGGFFPIPHDQIPELHDALLKALADHGIPKTRLNQGSLGASLRGQSLRFTYYYDYNDAEEVKRAEAINKEANAIITKLGTSMGAPFVYYRPTPINARKLMPQLGEYYQLLKILKRTLDPNRIMNPGHLMDLEPY